MEIENRCRAEFFSKDPVFGLEPPLLFAHRGGAREAPESTPKAFSLALNEAKTDVFELDAQLSRDGEIVVWHGPELDNVLLENAPVDAALRAAGRRNIDHFDWRELDGKAWVADHHTKDLALVPCEPERRILLFSELLDLYPGAPLNIELKPTFKNPLKASPRCGMRDHVGRFLRILKESAGDRKVLVASADTDILLEARRQSKERYPSNLTLKEQLRLLFLPPPESPPPRALETTHHRLPAHPKLVAKARRAGFPTFVFITGYGPLFPPLDRDFPPPEDTVLEILDRGVHGLMTDRPQWLRPLLNKWKNRRKS